VAFFQVFSIGAHQTPCLLSVVGDSNCPNATKCAPDATISHSEATQEPHKPRKALRQGSLTYFTLRDFSRLSRSHPHTYCYSK
jgi:hypothetical protein